MGAMSKFDKVRMLASVLSFKHYGPGLCGMFAFIAIIKWYSRTIKASRKALMPKTRQKPKDKVHVDGAFFRKLWRILKILVPSPFCGEVFYLILIAVALLSRTYADLYMITKTTRIEATIINRDKIQFILDLVKYILALPAISVTNTILKLRFRERLTEHLYGQYLNGFTFYKMSNLDNRIQNADQLLTQDVDKFCEGLVELYSNLTKVM
ncbi:unnamed protein product [Cylicostephanus goldi]|uniref:ABC transmembrane type-1 domain-containing protein n=1 Tax=Cylicostephanus goldi TaxID=71465 RepID=A0A3P6QVP5_CYLGO|nr:unnamed protein product [Cylicostephanus goldi]